MRWSENDGRRGWGASEGWGTSEARSPVCMNRRVRLCPIGGGERGMGFGLDQAHGCSIGGESGGAIAWFGEAHWQSGIWRGGDHGAPKPHPSSPLQDPVECRGPVPGRGRVWGGHQVCHSFPHSYPTPLPPPARPHPCLSLWSTEKQSWIPCPLH